MMKYEIDIIVLAGFLKILSSDFVRQIPSQDYQCIHHSFRHFVATYGLRSRGRTFIRCAKIGNCSFQMKLRMVAAIASACG